ncbi:kinesin light chain [Fusarium albosuccineum]|uniref:Kinesin light chain n=1 Tax=Fusarium albosuccineum TaxID=1237068 RepID=A0A8H4P341_9HYPO|nr:kinesin light chain [Fusarium albosuccineum]
MASNDPEVIIAIVFGLVSFFMMVVMVLLAMFYYLKETSSSLSFIETEPDRREVYSQLPFLIPYHLSPHFVGRSEILSRIKEELGVGQRRGVIQRLLSSQKRICLYGPSGIGKTQIALAYAYWLGAAYPEVSVFWVHASNVETFHQSYAIIAKECNIQGYDDPKVDLLRLVKRWLERKHKVPWLMVIDKADDTELFFQQETNERMLKIGQTEIRQHRELVDYIPECSHGAILFTTRDRGSPLVRGVSLIEVGNPNERDVYHFMQSILNNQPTLKSDAARLSSRLDGSPLALALAVSFMRYMSMPISKYMGLLNKVDTHLVNQLSQPYDIIGEESSIPHTVTAAWLVSFREIERPDNTLCWILHSISLFHCHGIPRGFLEYQVKMSGAAGVSQAYLETLEMLALVTEKKDGSLEMHRLIQLLTQRWLVDTGTIGRASDDAVSTLWDAYPFGEVTAHEMFLGFLPHACSVMQSYRYMSPRAKASSEFLMHIISTYLNCRGRWKDAAMSQAQTVAQRAKVLGEGHLHTLSSLDKLSLIHMHQNRFEEAELIQIYVWSVKRAVLGQENISTVGSLECLGVIGKSLWPEKRFVPALDSEQPVASSQPLDFPWEALTADLQAGALRRQAFIELPSNLPQLVDGILNRFPFLSSEPPVPEGHARVHWSCRCGQRLFDDFIASTPESLQELEKSLQNLNQTVDGDERGGGYSGNHQISWHWPKFTLHNHLGQLLRGKTNDSGVLPMHQINNRTQQPADETALYLLMCIDRGRHFTGLHQNVLQNVENDFQLFQFMREQSLQNRGFRPWLTFRTVQAVSLARVRIDLVAQESLADSFKFEVDNSQFAEVHNHRQVCGPDCVCIPPPERVESEEYKCSPAPTVKPSQFPVIGTNRLTHYFLKPHAFHQPQRIILNQLPKLAQGPLGTSEDTMQLGWGIHIQEGWHWRTIYFVLVFVFIIGSLVFGITWSVVKGDIQSAFAVTATWMAIGPLLLGYIAVRDLQ